MHSILRISILFYCCYGPPKYDKEDIITYMFQLFMIRLITKICYFPDNYSPSSTIVQSDQLFYPHLKRLHLNGYRKFNHQELILVPEVEKMFQAETEIKFLFSLTRHLFKHSHHILVFSKAKSSPQKGVYRELVGRTSHTVQSPTDSQTSLDRIESDATMVALLLSLV